MNFLNEFKINNKIIYKAYYVVFAIVLILNIFMFINPGRLVIYTEQLSVFAYPYELFSTLSTYLNITLALLFIIPLIIDYGTSILEIGLLGGEIRFNKAILQKMKISSIVSLVLFLATAINGYTIYIKEIAGRSEVISIGRVIFSASVPLIFIISFSIFLIVIMKGDGFSVALSIGFYLIVERFYPLLNIFIYFNEKTSFEAIFYRQIVHLAISIILILISLLKIKRSTQVDRVE